MDRYLCEKLECRVKELEHLCCKKTINLAGFRFCKLDDVANAAVNLDDANWPPFEVGAVWGGYDEVIWIRGELDIPQQMRGETLDLRLQLGPRDGADTTAETLLYLDGVETHGLDNWHDTLRLTWKQAKQGKLQLAMRAWSGLVEPPRRFAIAELRAIDVDTEKLYYLCKILLETAAQLEENDLRRIRLLRLVDGAFSRIDYRNVRESDFYTSTAEALRFACAELSAMDFDGEEKPTVAVCGHSHIDMAWLWRLCHTCEKGARSFSTVLSLMERYPEYLFSQSSPLLYEMIRTKYPDLFERIRERIAEGRWEITGGTWVEPDTNLPSGESLVRQILLGKRYMKSMFGVESTVLWLPDVFGYSWVLPQLLKKSGIRLFWTNKMSWNQYNRFPHDTFLWRGLDGSEILTQLGTCPEKNVTWGSTYNGIIAPWEVKGTWDKYAQKDLNDEVLMPFGWGDGGGGPTREMLEAYDVMRDLPGLPKVEMKNCEQFAEDLENRTKDQKLPIWDGEMYFEYHRGTYTSQAFVKRANRKNEVLYHDAELFCSLNRQLLNMDYPRERINENWKKLCTNQFHDIIPGSSIHSVYDDARKLYQEIATDGESILSDTLRQIAANIAVSNENIVVFNPLPWEREAVVELGPEYNEKTLLVDGKKAPAQTVTGENGMIRLVQVDGLPPMGYRSYPVVEVEHVARPPATSAGADGVENSRYRIRLNEQGQITELYDKSANRQVIRPGTVGNVLQVFEDKPHQFDAWNTEIYAFDKMNVVNDLQSIRVVENGSVRTVLELIYRYNRSTIWQRMILKEGSPEICFDTLCDWQEESALLKVCFDVAIHSTKATYEIQFGNLERPTHSNTSWDYAQFEVCAHRWADLSEGNYGVSLLNDCKYGHDIKNSAMRLTLIKSASYPDKTADCGEHRFLYALLPHENGWREGGVVRVAAQLNDPVCAVAAGMNRVGTLPSSFGLVWAETDNVMVDTVKYAEDSDTLIVRVYEYMQNRGDTALHFGAEIEFAAECDLLENVICELPVKGKTLRYSIAPYEVKTFQIRLKRR